MSDSVTADRPGRPGWVSWLVHFPVTRIVLYLGGIAVALWILRLTARGLAAGLGAWWPAGVANVVLPILVVHLVYRGITRALERRPAAELALRGAFRETAAGMLAGAACLTVTVGLIAALGYYQVEAIGSGTALAAALGIGATSGYIEEVIFRGVVFRIVEEALGTWSALVITVALFGLAHLGNPNASLYGAAAIGIEAGLLLGAAYVLTRRLWLAIGIHFGWNFMQAGVFGPHLSGRQVGSLLESRLSGPDVLSGGALGVEGSVFAILVCLLASLALLLQARHQHLFIRPFWRRQQIS